MFKEYNQKQGFLLPPSYEEYLGENHESRVLNEIINELDINSLYKSYNNKNKGTSAYNPQMLLKVLFYGYMNETFSSREIAKKLKSDLGFMFLAGNNTPDFRTINNFRKNKGTELEEIFVKIVELAEKIGMINFGTFSLDGTKIYANASKHKNYTEEQLEKQLRERIGGLFDLADEIDEKEDKMYGENEDDLPEELNNSKKRKEALKKAKEKLEKSKKKLEEAKEKLKKENAEKKSIKTKNGRKQKFIKRINITDGDTRYMQMKRKDSANGYNCQILEENGIIVGNYVDNNSSDIRSLIPSLEKLQRKYNKLPKILLADKGYPSEENFEYLKSNNVNGYIPIQKEQIKLEDYEYDERRDIYKDKDGNIYKFKQYSLNKNIEKRKRGRPLKMEKKDENDYYAKLYFTKLKNGKKKYLEINKEWLKYQKQQKSKLETKEGKEIYKIRIGVERVFGNIKQNLGFERFSLRGIEKVKIEWNLINMVHNLKKIMKFQAC